MRKYKFRGKRTEDGEWVYGDLGQSKGIVFISDQNLKPQDTWAFTYEVDPETIGQFTEKIDDKEREVYEHDIYFNEVEHDYGDERIYFVCTWIPEWCRFVWLTIGEYQAYEDNGVRVLEEDETMMNTFGLDTEKLHYAGNIHDNKDLLK